MRTIEFRGKRKDTGEWVYGNYHRCTDLYGDKVDKHYISKINSTYEYGEQNDYEIIPETLGQYINLNDMSTGIKIYEGDLVKRDGFDEIYEIKFSEDDFGFKMYGLGEYGYHHNSRWQYIYAHMEVIGNIHEKKKYYVYRYFEDIKNIVGKNVKVKIDGEKELIYGKFESYNHKYKLIFDKKYNGMDYYPVDKDIFEESETDLSIEYIVVEECK